MTGRGGPQSVGNALQGGGTIHTNFWFGDLGNFGRNGEEGKGRSHRFSYTDHREASVTDIRREMGDYHKGINTGSGGSAVGEDLHRETTGNCGTVGDVVADI